MYRRAARDASRRRARHAANAAARDTRVRAAQAWTHMNSRSSAWKWTVARSAWLVSSCRGTGGSRCGKAGPAQPATLRRGGRLRRLPCGTRSHGRVANSLRELRSLRSDSRDEVRLRSALRAPAMGAAFLGASQAHRRLCGSYFAETLVVFVARTTGAPTSCQAPPDRGDFWYPSMSLWRVVPGATR